MEVLVVEDDEVLGKALRRGLEDAGHRCTWTKSGEKGLQEATRQKCDAILLDLMLPDRSGLDILRNVRDQGVRTPVIILTALGSVEERVAGLGHGQGGERGQQQTKRDDGGAYETFQQSATPCITLDIGGAAGTEGARRVRAASGSTPVWNGGVNYTPTSPNAQHGPRPREGRAGRAGGGAGRGLTG